MAPESILFRIDRFEVGQTVTVFDRDGANVMFKRATVEEITASDVIVSGRNRMSKTRLKTHTVQLHQLRSVPATTVVVTAPATDQTVDNADPPTPSPPCDPRRKRGSPFTSLDMNSPYKSPAKLSKGDSPKDRCGDVKISGGTSASGLGGSLEFTSGYSTKNTSGSVCKYQNVGIFPSSSTLNFPSRSFPQRSQVPMPGWMERVDC